MAISPQRVTIYLYSAHRAVIFAIAQFSCLALNVNISKTVAGTTKVSISEVALGLSIDTNMGDQG